MAKPKTRWFSTGYNHGRISYYWDGPKRNKNRRAVIRATDRLEDYIQVAKLMKELEQVLPLFLEDPYIHIETDYTYSYGEDEKYLALSGERYAYPAETEQIIAWEAHIIEEQTKQKNLAEEEERAELARLKAKYEGKD